MAFRFNPFTGNLDLVGDSEGGGTPGGSDTNIQFNDNGSFGGSSDFTWNDTTKSLSVGGNANLYGSLTAGGDVELNDGGLFTTTVQSITPTANRFISFPDATGTVALVGGSSGQVIWNNAGSLAGASTLTYDGSVLTTSGRFVNSYNATVGSAPAKTFTGTWFSGGTATTTKPHVLIEPAGTTSTAWSTNGTGLGVNAASGFTGNLLDLQVNGVRMLSANSSGDILAARSFAVPENTGYIALGGSGGTGTRFQATGGGTIRALFNGITAVSLSSGGYIVESNKYYAFTSGDIGNPVDLTIFRDAANTLAQRNGTNAQTFRVYNTFTDSSNYSLGKIAWERSTSTATTNGFISGTTLTVDSGTGIAVNQIVTGTGVLPGTRIISGSGTTWTVSQSQTVGSTGSRVAMVFGDPALRVGTENLGTGVARPLDLQTNGTTRVQIGASGDVNITTNGAASLPPLDLTGTWFTGGTSTTTKPQLLVEPAGTSSTNWSTNGTGLGVNAPSGFTGNLLDLQVNGSTLLRVNSNPDATSGFGQVVVPSNGNGGFAMAGRFQLGGITGALGGILRFGNASVTSYIYTFGGAIVDGVSGTPVLSLSQNAVLGFGSSNNFVTTDLDLRRDAADTLAQRRGTNAQTFRLYNTFTSATDHERGKLEWSSNVFRIGTEKGSGGGTARAMELQTDGVTRLALSATGTVTSNNDFVVNGGSTFTTTIQSITPTANRFITLPDRSGTVGLIAGSNGQLIYNNAGVYAGLTTLSADTSGNLTLSGRLTNTYSSVADSPAKRFSGAWFTGGTATTTKPHVLIEPTGTTSTAWSTNGTGLGVNAPSGFTGNLLDLQVNGSSVFSVPSTGRISITGSVLGGIASSSWIDIFPTGSTNPLVRISNGVYRFAQAATNGTPSIELCGGWASSAGDVVIIRDAADTLAQRRTTNPQTFRLYNTITGTDVSATGNYERGFLRWNSNALEIGTEVGSGGGTLRPVLFPTNAAASTPPLSLTGTWFTGGTATTTKPQFLIEPAGTTSTAWSTNGTGLGVNAPSGFTGNLLDLQVNGTSLFRIAASGALTCASGGTFTFGVSASSFSAADSNRFTWLSGDIAIYRGSSSAIEIRNAAAPTSATGLRIYNTFTSATNFERLNFRWASNEAIIDTEAGGGGGTLRGLKIGSASTSLLGFYGATPVDQPAAVADLTATATTGSLPTPDGTVTIANAASPTNTELLEYCVELEAKLEAALSRLRELGLIAT